VGLVGAYAMLSTARWQAGAAGLAGAALVMLAAGLLRRRPSAVPAAVLLAAAAYGVAVVGRDPAFDAGSIAVAALLLVAAELGLWSAELASPVRYDPGILLRRVVLVAALGLGSLGGAAVVAAAAGQSAEPSLVLGGIGAAAAVVVAGVLARLAMRRAGPGS
jgi:hypothetical protein